MHLRRTIFLLALFFGSTTILFAAAPSGGYAPGLTLDPSCAPNDTDCIVRSLEAQDEGTSLTSNALVFNFTGAGVTATESGGTVTVDISGSSGGLTSLNGLTGGTQTFAIGSSGTSPAWSSSGTTHTLNLPTASGTNTGILSASDWTTFNNKQAALELYRENPSTPTTPVASGANAVAIGSAAVASNTNALSIGTSTSVTGTDSVAIGSSATANVNQSVSIGYSVTASANQALVIGRLASAGGSNAAAIGSNAHARASNATAVGAFSDANSQFSTAVGYSAYAIDYANAFGYEADAVGASSVAIGNFASADGTRSIAIGSNTIASARDSIVFGKELEAYSPNEMAIGFYGTTYTPQATTAIDPDDRLFVIGNGTDLIDRHDALTILKNGNMSIGIDNWEADLDAADVRLKVEGPRSSTVAIFSDGLDTCEITPSTAGGVTCSSDARLKKDIETITQDTALDAINALRPVHYFWNDDTDGSNPQQGFIAQEIRDVFPELVRTGNNGMLSVSYVGLIPSIVASIQELTEKVANIFDTFTSQKITAEEELCVDDVCLTKDDVRALLQEVGRDSEETPVVEDTTEEESVPVDEPIPETETTPPDAE